VLLATPLQQVARRLDHPRARITADRAEASLRLARHDPAAPVSAVAAVIPEARAGIAVRARPLSAHARRRAAQSPALGSSARTVNASRLPAASAPAPGQHRRTRHQHGRIAANRPSGRCDAPPPREPRPAGPSGMALHLTRPSGLIPAIACRRKGEKDCREGAAQQSRGEAGVWGMTAMMPWRRWNSQSAPLAPSCPAAWAQSSRSI
jgi:hypothetical protein